MIFWIIAAVVLIAAASGKLGMKARIAAWLFIFGWFAISSISCKSPYERRQERKQNRREKREQFKQRDRVIEPIFDRNRDRVIEPIFDRKRQKKQNDEGDRRPRPIIDFFEKFKKRDLIFRTYPRETD